MGSSHIHHRGKILLSIGTPEQASSKINSLTANADKWTKYEEVKKAILFDNLTPFYPEEKFILDHLCWGAQESYEQI